VATSPRRTGSSPIAESQLAKRAYPAGRWYAGLRPVKLEMKAGVLAELARG
jgi:hypothetical protein